MNAPENLRDWFAGMAMQGLIAAGAYSRGQQASAIEMARGGIIDTKKKLAEQSYAIADAFMEFRDSASS